MTADIRMALENELDQLQESGVESWLSRCFDACDPRYDSDWLNGIFELALMQFPDNYEVRAAASKAATMEAQRLFDEGDKQEAVGRLERLLESDPYCTEAFELLEKFMGGGEATTEDVEGPVATAPEPVELPDDLEPVDDDLLSFLNEDLVGGLDKSVAVEPPTAAAEPAEPSALEGLLDSDELLLSLDDHQALQPDLPPVAEAAPVASEPAPVAGEQATVAPEPAPVAPEPVPSAPLSPVALTAALESDLPEAEPELRPELHAEPEQAGQASPPPATPAVAATPEAAAATVAPLPPVPAAVAAEPPRPAAPPVVSFAPSAPAAEAPAPPSAPPRVATIAAPARREGSFDWRSVVSLPAHNGSQLEPQLEALLPSLTERFTQVGNYRSLVLLLSDLFNRDPQHTGVRSSLNSVLRDWAQQLEAQGRGAEAGQVAAWSRGLLGAQAAWSDDLVSRFPASLPSLPDLHGLGGSSTPAWMSWVQTLRDDPSRYNEAGQALAGDPSGLQSLFRHLAVNHPNDPDHVLNLGWAYSQCGQHALGMVHTQRSLQLRPGTRGFTLLQKIYTDLGQPDMAQRVAQQASQTRS